MRFRRKRVQNSKRRGAILLLIAVSMIGLMGVMVMAIDGGLLQRQRRIAQLAADAAAKAAAIEIYRYRTDSIIPTAVSEATRNGFTNGVGGKAVIVTWPSAEPGFSGANFVQVQVRDTVRTVFASIWGRARVPVNARSVAGVTGGAVSCMVALDPDDNHAFIVQSGAHVTAVGCTVSVNSNNSGAACVTASEGGILDAAGLNITGNYDTGCRGTVTGTIKNGQTAASDPLSSVVPLLSDTLSNALSSCKGGLYDPHLSDYDASATINPSSGAGGVGAYCGGIHVSKSTTTLTMNPGIYVIRGGGFDVSSDARVVGNGVAIINLNPPPSENVNRFEPINFAGAKNINLTAMTTGTFAGIVIYSPAGQGVPVELNRIHSATNATIGGSMYFPDQALEVSSGHDDGVGTTLNITGGIVAGAINFAADSRVNVQGFAGGAPGGVRKASLVK